MRFYWGGWYSRAADHARLHVKAYNLCGETYCSTKYPSATPHGFIMTDTTVWCKHYVFTALCALDSPNEWISQNSNSALQSEGIFYQVVWMLGMWCSALLNKYKLYMSKRMTQGVVMYFLFQQHAFVFTVCLFVPETLNLWGQIRSQVRCSGTGLHALSSTKVKQRRNINCCIYVALKLKT